MKNQIKILQVIAYMMGTTFELIPGRSDGKPSWGARFSDLVEIKEGGSLRGVTCIAFGKKDCVNAFLRNISGKTLVIHAGNSRLRKTFDLPNLTN